MTKFYAHTAEDGQGNPLPEQSGKWQPLSTHLRNVAALAEKFAAPLRLEREAKLAGLLHDLGKYAARFQARLRNPAIHGINHWAAGTVQAASLKAWATAFAAEGHHTGIPALNDNTAGASLRQTVAKFAAPETRSELTGQCPESMEDLLARFTNDKLQLPSFTMSRGIRSVARLARAGRFLSAESQRRVVGMKNVKVNKDSAGRRISHANGVCSPKRLKYPGLPSALL